MIYKYKCFCVNENKEVFWILDKSLTPTTCPNNTAHALDSSQTVLIQIGDIPAAREVVTQFEKNDKDLKICSAECPIDSSGEAMVEFMVPGDPALGEGRYVDEGIAFFDTPLSGDRVTEVNIIDVYNIFGMGENVTVKTYHDEEVPDEQKGWRIPTRKGEIVVDTLAGYGFIPAMLKLQIKCKREVTTGKFTVNVKWGKKE